METVLEGGGDNQLWLLSFVMGVEGRSRVVPVVVKVGNVISIQPSFGLSV